MNCRHYEHRYNNAAWVGRLSPPERTPVLWELCPMTAPEPLADGFCVVRYRCSGCSYVVDVLSLYRHFPPGSGDGYFHSVWSLREAMATFRRHLNRHRSAGASVSFHRSCREVAESS